MKEAGHYVIQLVVYKTQDVYAGDQLFNIELVHEEGYSTTKVASTMATRSRIPGIGGKAGPSSVTLPSGLQQPTKYTSANDGHTAKVSPLQQVRYYGTRTTCTYCDGQWFRGDLHSRYQQLPYRYCINRGLCGREYWRAQATTLY